MADECGGAFLSGSILICKRGCKGSGLRDYSWSMYMHMVVRREWCRIDGYAMPTAARMLQIM